MSPATAATFLAQNWTAAVSMTLCSSDSFVNLSFKILAIWSLEYGGKCRSLGLPAERLNTFFSNFFKVNLKVLQANKI